MPAILISISLCVGLDGGALTCRYGCFEAGVFTSTLSAVRIVGIFNVILSIQSLVAKSSCLFKTAKVKEEEETDPSTCSYIITPQSNVPAMDDMHLPDKTYLSTC